MTFFTKLSQHRFELEASGENINLRVVDTMGFEVPRHAGLHTDDIPNVIDGKIKEGYYVSCGHCFEILYLNTVLITQFNGFN